MKNDIQITLMVTENCNLACRYCYEKNKTLNNMTFETAKKIIDKEFSSVSEDAHVQIEFFGGEPFLNFALIKKVVEYVDEHYPNRAGYNTTTNGTVLTPEIKKWLKEHINNFYAALSLDGTEEIHNMNRVFNDSAKGSYSEIDQSFFLETYHPAIVKMTIAPNVLGRMAEGIIHLHKKGFIIDATLAVGDIDWSDSDNVYNLVNQLKALIGFYQDNPEYKVIRMLDIPVEAIFNEKKNNCRNCGAGLNMHCYTEDSLNWVPCQGFSKTTLGDMSFNYINETFEKHISKNEICMKCKLENICSKCWATNLASTGDIDKINPDLCLINRYIILAASKIIYHRIIDKEEVTADDYLKLNAVAEICKVAIDKSNKFVEREVNVYEGR